MNNADIGFNKFCGPAVLSILTGMTSDECAYEISMVTGNHTVKGVTTQNLMSAGNRMGLKFEPISVMNGRSLFFAASQYFSRNEGMYLLVVPGHFVVVESRDGKLEFCDNHTKTPINLSSSARLSQKVEECYKVTLVPIEKPKPVTQVSRSISVERVSNSVIIERLDRYSDGTLRNIRLATLSGFSSDELRFIGEGIIKNA